MGPCGARGAEGDDGREPPSSLADVESRQVAEKQRLGDDAALELVERDALVGGVDERRGVFGAEEEDLRLRHGAGQSRDEGDRAALARVHRVGVEGGAQRGLGHGVGGAVGAREMALPERRVLDGDPDVPRCRGEQVVTERLADLGRILAGDDAGADLGPRPRDDRVGRRGDVGGVDAQDA